MSTTAGKPVPGRPSNSTGCLYGCQCGSCSAGWTATRQHKLYFV